MQGIGWFIQLWFLPQIKPLLKPFDRNAAEKDRLKPGYEYDPQQS